MVTAVCVYCTFALQIVKLLIYIVQYTIGSSDHYTQYYVHSR
jgi:hypothetical protein